MRNDRVHPAQDALVWRLEGAEKRPAADVVREVGELAETLAGALPSVVSVKEFP